MYLRIMKFKEVTYVALSIVTLTAFVAIMVKSNERRYEAVSMEATADSECQCFYKNHRYDFCYRLPVDNSIKGLRVDCGHAKYLQKLGLLNDKYAINLEIEKFPEPVFVTAMSENHFREGLTLIANFRKFWPQQKLYIYDLGLGKMSADKLRKMCLVKLRRFPFSGYPEYVRKLMEYRWKPILIAEMLQKYGAVWYMDTSVRWKKDKRDIVYDELKCRKGGEWELVECQRNAPVSCVKCRGCSHQAGVIDTPRCIPSLGGKCEICKLR